jgi:hypothetical protein
MRLVMYMNDHMSEGHLLKQALPTASPHFPIASCLRRHNTIYSAMKY